MWRLLFLFALVSGNVWASLDSTIPVEKTSSSVIKTTPGVVYSVNMSYVGVVAGRKIQIRDGQTGNIQLTLVAATTSGSQIAQYPTGIIFPTSIYYSDPDGSSGTITTDIQYN